ncbi:MAG TPA: hypothetical protein VNA15_03405 [Candidatus Angelobacter sp.]|nr:hypothetical protein [Candidatus Angelobacter sp.]
MKFHVDSRMLLSSIFLLLGAGSTVFVAVASLNYVQLYPATSSLEVTLSKILYRNGLTASVIVSNPVDYTGLTVTRGSLSIYFLSGSDYLFKNSTISDSVNLHTAIAARADTAWDWTINLSANQTSTLASFYTSHNQNVTAHYSLLLVVASFLQGQAGATPYAKEDQVPLLH